MTANSSGYSARVEIHLILNGESLNVGQLGPEHCMLREPREFPPSPAEIVLIVDDEETRLPVFLKNGGTATDRCIPYTLVAPATVPIPTLASH
jgi:hypothetical protein